MRKGTIGFKVYVNPKDDGKWKWAVLPHDYEPGPDLHYIAFWDDQALAFGTVRSSHEAFKQAASAMQHLHERILDAQVHADAARIAKACTVVST